MNEYNNRGVWSIGGPKSSKSPPLRLPDGTTATTDSEICQAFFLKAAEKSTKKTADIVEPAIHQSEGGKTWNFEVTYSQEVYNLMLDKYKKCTPGPFGISPKFVRKIASVMAKPTADLYNLMITRQEYPRILNLGKSLPVFKKKAPATKHKTTA